MLDELRKAAGKHGLTFGPDPATHSRNTLGGMIGNNSCGIHSMMAGETVDNIDELDIVLYDGTRMTVGATSEQELERIIARGRPQRRDLRPLESSARQVRRPDSTRVPDDPAARFRLQPAGTPAGAGLQRRQGAGRHRGHLRARAGSEDEARRQSAGSLAARPRLSRTSSHAADDVVEPAKFHPIGLGGAGRHVHRVHEEEGPASSGPELHAGGRGVAAGRIRRHGPRTKRTRMPASAWTSSEA